VVHELYFPFHIKTMLPGPFLIESLSYLGTSSILLQMQMQMQSGGEIYRLIILGVSSTFKGTFPCTP
jgi:hypothetical protein